MGLVFGSRVFQKVLGGFTFNDSETEIRKATRSLERVANDHFGVDGGISIGANVKPKNLIYQMFDLGYFDDFAQLLFKDGIWTTENKKILVKDPNALLGLMVGLMIKDSALTRTVRYL